MKTLRLPEVQIYSAQKQIDSDPSVSLVALPPSFLLGSKPWIPNHSRLATPLLSLNQILRLFQALKTSSASVLVFAGPGE